MKRYVVEQAQPGRVVRRHVRAEGYLWAQGGVVSFQRRFGSEDLETFSTLYNCTAVYEHGTVGDPEDGDG